MKDPGPASVAPEPELEAGGLAGKFRRLTLLAGIFGLAATALLPLRPPAPIPSRADEGQFSAARALMDLRQIARAPRPLASAEHERVASWLARRLESLGLETHMQRLTTLQPLGPRVLAAAPVVNIVGRLPGRGVPGAVLLMAHYDSVAGSPGAADDGSGVAAVLEALRALRSGPALARDIIVLFSDAEEVGLFGATAFQANHPWAARVAVVVNLEARGSRGPSVLFETGPGAAPLWAAFAKSSPRPVAVSWASEVYRHLPYDSDFTPFRRAELAGFNLAFFADGSTYHTPLDTVERLDLRSLQHHGGNLLALARRLGDSPPGEPATGSRQVVAFPLPGDELVVYPASTGHLLTLVAAVTGVLILRRESQRGRRLQALGRGMVALSAGAVAGALTAVCIHAVAVVLLWVPSGGRGGLLYQIGLALLVVAVAMGVSGTSIRSSGARFALAASLPAWLLVAVLSALTAPAASYLFTWPALAAAAALYATRARAFGPRRWPAVGLGLVTAVPLLWLWVPSLGLMAQVLGTWGAPITAVLGLAPALLLVCQLGSIESPLLAAKTRVLLLGAAGASLLLLSLVASPLLAQPRDRPGHPALYAVDHDRNRAAWTIWAGCSRRWQDRLAAAFSPLPPPTGRDLELHPATTRQNVAVAHSYSPPEVRLIEGRDSWGGGQRLRLNIRSPRSASTTDLDLSSSTRIRQVTVGDSPAHRLQLDQFSRGSTLRLRYHGVPPEGFDLTVELAGNAPLHVKAADEAGASDRTPPRTLTRCVTGGMGPRHLPVLTRVETSYVFQAAPG